MSFITREEFLGKPQQFMDVDVPELEEGKQICVYKIGAKDKVTYMGGFWKLGADGKAEFDASGCRPRLLILACRNGDGSPLFTAEDVAALEAYDPEVIERLAEAAEKLSGLDATAEELRHVRHDAKVVHERNETVPERDCAGTHVRADDGLLSRCW